jgi:hypothetical protein
MPRTARWRDLVSLACLLAIAAALVGDCGAQARDQGTPPDTFAGRVAALSEPGGYFDTDNLISNERSYLHVTSDLTARGVRGGAYLGVGPDQNFSYIAQVRPSIAIIVDIRRDNLLLHLLFKGMFELARTRVEYLAILTGRSPPEPLAGWEARPIDAIVAQIDAARPAGPAAIDAVHGRLLRAIRGYGVPLSAADLETIARFHRQFIDSGLSLQFTSTGRPPQRGYPTYRDLLLEVDRSDARRSFLATAEAFQFVKALHARHLVIPIVGNLSGQTALAAVGRFLHARNEPVSAFYASNVEFYLFRDGTFARFIANLERLPHAANGVMIRSVFGGGATPPEPGYNSVSMLQPIRTLLDGYARGQFRQYWELTR